MSVNVFAHFVFFEKMYSKNATIHTPSVGKAKAL
jgi:hypothetical protein